MWVHYNLHESQIDFAKLIGILRKDRLLIGTYYYNAPLDINYNKETYWKQQRFFADLRKMPALHIILAHMRKTKKPDGTFEFAVKGDDIHLAIDMVSFAYENLYDTAILVSGDGDFAPAVKRVQKLGKQAENAYFTISRSSLLKQVSNTSIALDDIAGKCLKSSDKKDK